MPNPRVVVVMLTLNQRETTLRALRSMSPEERRLFPVLVWGNYVVVQPGFAEALLAPFQDDDRIGKTQAKLLYLGDPQRIDDGGIARSTSGRAAPTRWHSTKSTGVSATRWRPASRAEAR